MKIRLIARPISGLLSIALFRQVRSTFASITA